MPFFGATWMVPFEPLGAVVSCGLLPLLAHAPINPARPRIISVRMVDFILHERMATKRRAYSRALAEAGSTRSSLPSWPTVNVMGDPLFVTRA